MSPETFTEVLQRPVDALAEEWRERNRRSRANSLEINVPQ
jgi:hypothetical protein